MGHAIAGQVEKGRVEKTQLKNKLYKIRDVSRAVGREYRGSGRVGSGRIGSDRVGSGRVGWGGVRMTRPDP